MRPEPKNAQSQWSIRFLRALRTKTGVRHIVAVRHHNRSQVSIPINHIDSHVTLWHRDAEAAVITSPFLHHVATMFSNHLNQAHRCPWAPIDLQLEKLECRRQHESTTINGSRQ